MCPIGAARAKGQRGGTFPGGRLQSTGPQPTQGGGRGRPQAGPSQAGGQEPGQSGAGGRGNSKRGLAVRVRCLLIRWGGCGPLRRVSFSRIQAASSELTAELPTQRASAYLVTPDPGRHARPAPLSARGQQAGPCLAAPGQGDGVPLASLLRPSEGPASVLAKDPGSPGLPRPHELLRTPSPTAVPSACTHVAPVAGRPCVWFGLAGSESGSSGASALGFRAGRRLGDRGVAPARADGDRGRHAFYS